MPFPSASLDYAGGGCGVAVIPLGPAPARLSWAAATALSSISLRIASPAQVRDWVDVRFPLELLGVCIVLAMA